MGVNMESETKSMGLLTQLAKGLLAHSKMETEKQLGDRTKYIGMSDIGKGAECMRAAVANKVNGRMQPETEALQKLFSEKDYSAIQAILNKELILQRGHWLETGVMQAFKANGAKIFSQLEIDIDDNGTPVKAHLDFVLVWGGKHPAVRILELKSTENTPKNLYTAYETQLYGQLGFLSKFWESPNFNMKSENGKTLFTNLNFPEIVRKAFNIEMPDDPKKVDIEGWVLCLAMSEAKAFGPYKPNETMLNFCRKTAKTIWDSTKAVNAKSLRLNDIEYCEGFHPLCDWCDHSGDCPKFKSVEIKDPVCNEILSELEALKNQKTKLEKEIAESERRVKDFYHKNGIVKDWISTEDYRFKCSEVDGRKSLDDSLLSSELSKLIGAQKGASLLEAASKKGEPYERLYINKIKKGK